MVFCKDCKHCDYSRSQPLLSSRCRKSVIHTSVVNGDQVLGYCNTERSFDGKCGPEGRLFEQVEYDDEEDDDELEYVPEWRPRSEPSNGPFIFWLLFVPTLAFLLQVYALYSIFGSIG